MRTTETVERLLRHDWLRDAYFNDPVVNRSLQNSCVKDENAENTLLSLVCALVVRHEAMRQDELNRVKQSGIPVCVPISTFPQTARKLAHKLLEEYNIGNSSRFCDETDWDPVAREKLVEFIAAELAKDFRQ